MRFWCCSQPYPRPVNPPHTPPCTSDRVIPAGVNAYNPSQDLRTMVSNLRNAGQKSVIAVAPAFEQHAPDEILSSLPPSSARHLWEKGEKDVRSMGGHGGTGGESDGRVERRGVRGGAESLAAQDFSSWLINELGGSDG